MKILVIEPYFTGSHAAWATGYQKHSRHDVEILKLGGAFWKWRMHGGAVTLARRFLEGGVSADLIVATDMLDLTTFQALTRVKTATTPMVVYFHENQLSYPWSPTDRDVAHKRDKHYGFINYSSALAADAAYFNSKYHMESFLKEVERLLKHFPDHNELGTVARLRAKSSVLRLGLDLERFDAVDGVVTAATVGGSGGVVKGDEPLVLWNHRWEYDKNPEEFFAALSTLAGRGVAFRLAVLGENFSQVPDVFLEAKEALGDRVVQFGYADGFETYARWLRTADVLPVTSNQDFFGAGVVEAVYCGCRPLLPRRLAYPELIPGKFHDDVFYDGDFVERLEVLLRQPWRRTKEEQRPQNLPEALRTAMRRFDWRTMAPMYDRIFEDAGDPDSVRPNPGS